MDVKTAQRHRAQLSEVPVLGIMLGSYCLEVHNFGTGTLALQFSLGLSHYLAGLA